MNKRIAFIGGGNMASAIITGLLGQGFSPSAIDVIDPDDATRQRLQTLGPLNVHPRSDTFLRTSDLVIWAVKPQSFADAATAIAPFTNNALHLSVAAGIPSQSIAQWLGTERIIRTMPNTPALIGQGVTGMYARPAVPPADRNWANDVMAATGRVAWVQSEPELDAVTALSGSGPAYVFYFIEAMTEAGIAMGLAPNVAQQLAIGTFCGASALAQQATESPAELRQRVTSKGGTTYAALQSLENNQVKQHFIAAMQAAQQRARELGAEFGQA